MNFGDLLPPDSHAVRLAKASQAPDGEPPGGAFELRKEIDEEELSVGWAEYFKDPVTEEEQVSVLLQHLRRNNKPNPTGRVLWVDVAFARLLLRGVEDLANVEFVYSPVKDKPGVADDPCHASIVGLFPLPEPMRQLAALQIALAVTANCRWRDLVKSGMAPAG
ncbi:MAG: hypothetical protein U1F09_02090 [Steroidobacteraceae bacterium]